MIKLENVKSPFMCYCAKVIPLAFDESMSYYECLCNFYNYLKNEIMPAINNNAEATKELQDLFIELKEYVDHYFDNLDITEEVNAKLDEMVEDGTMEQLIAQYLQLQTTYTFNSVAELKEATNLVNGMIVKTLGYYGYNQGGGALYKIRNLAISDTVDDMFILSLDDETLVAEYIVENNEINILSVGAKGDLETDNTEILQAVIDKCEEEALKMIIPNGNYLVSDTLYIDSKITIEGQGDNSLWSENTIYPCITGVIADKPIFHISKSATTYNWNNAGSNMVENVHFKNFRIYGINGDNESVRGLTGIYADCYLSSFENMVVSGFYNDIALASCYETIIDNCQFMNAYQQIVLYYTNDTVVIRDTYCNGSYDTANSVISNATYQAKYNVVHKYNYCNLYSNLAYAYFDNLALEKSCYAIIDKDSNLYGDKIHIEAIRDCCFYHDVDLRANNRLELDTVSFYNTASYNSCVLYNNRYLGRIDIKTINALPLSNFQEGTSQTRTINRIYSYITGEKIISLTLSENVSGATIINNSHYTPNGFKVDYWIKNASTWNSSSATTITGNPTTNALTSDDFTVIRGFPGTNINTSVINMRYYPIAHTLAYYDNSNLGGTALQSPAKIHIDYEYPIN